MIDLKKGSNANIDDQLEMFRRPSFRKRTLLAMGFAFIGQSTGVLVLNNYGKLSMLLVLQRRDSFLLTSFRTNHIRCIGI